MSGARRKSKNPQKWEESLGNDSNSLESTNTKPTNWSSSTEGSNYNKSLMTSFLPSSLSRKAPNKEENVNSKGKLKLCSGPIHHERSSDEEGELNLKGSVPGEGEMTVLDVLQGSRPGLVAECKSCSIQLKDWASTVSHIRSHRLVFIPLCVRDNENSALKQSVTCLVCQKVCQNLSVLAFHAHNDHSLTKAPMVCPFCGRLFSSTSAIQRHIDTRDVCMKCPVCSATYDQEFELYAHLSDCLPTFHPHLKSLTCHVCRQRLPMPSLADHMINHSMRGHEVRPIKPHRKSGSSSKHGHALPLPAGMGPKVFLCEICDGRFNHFDNFRRHLYDHTETKMYCPLCFLKGFEKGELILRHLMLRCPRRSREQFEFGTILYLIGKEQKLSFLQVLKSVHHLQPFKEGFQTWSSVTMVQEMLKNIDQIRKEEPGAAEGGVTDIELLLWLSDFEREVQKQRSEIDPHLLGKNMGEGDRRHVAGHTPHLAHKKHSPDVDIYLNDRSPKTSAVPKSAPPVEETYPKLINMLLENQATPSDMPPDFPKNYPGVKLLHDVGVKHLKSLYDEAISSKAKEDGSSILKSSSSTFSGDLERLEWEAQYLRKKEPFFLPSQDEVRMLSPLYKKTKHLQVKSEVKVDPEAMARISKELEEMKEELPVPVKTPLIDQSILNALLQEAKEG